MTPTAIHSRSQEFITLRSNSPWPHGLEVKEVAGRAALMSGPRLTRQRGPAVGCCLRGEESNAGARVQP
jgi:hypothetical protein